MAFVSAVPVFAAAADPFGARKSSSPQRDILGLPIAAQGSISAALGRDDRAYHAARVPNGLRASNGKHGLKVRFSRDAVTVATGADRIAFSLRGLGYGDALQPVASAKPVATNNRVEYRRGKLTEWYANGPLGLEQGFTLDAPPQRTGSGSLTLALSVRGNLEASLEPGNRGIRLGRRGAPAIDYSGLTAVDAAGRELQARVELADAKLLLRIDDKDARYPVVIDPFIKKATLVASDGKPEDSFGISVAASGDTIVVGAYNPPHLDDFLPGAAYVFVKPASGWLGTLTETAKLTGSDADSGSWFGISVAIDGDTVVVGASLHTIGGNNSQGAAYVFVKPAGGGPER